MTNKQKNPNWAREEAEKTLKVAIDSAVASPGYNLGEEVIDHFSKALLSAYEKGREKGIDESAKLLDEKFRNHFGFKRGTCIDGDQIRSLKSSGKEKNNE